MSNQQDFDHRILRYQEKHHIKVPSTPKRALNGSQSERAVKRQRVEEEHDSQESQWVRINWPTPKNDERRQGQDRNGDQPAEVNVKVEKPNYDDPVTSRRKEQHVVQNEDDDRDDDEDGDEDDDDTPPGSEDYDGEIFEEADENENEDNVDQRVSDTDEDDNVEEDNAAEDSKAMLNGDLATSVQKEHEISEGPQYTR